MMSPEGSVFPYCFMDVASLSSQGIVLTGNSRVLRRMALSQLSFVGSCLFFPPLAAFKIFSLLLILSNLAMVHHISSYFLCLGFFELGSVSLWFSLNLEKFQLLFLQILLFCSFLFLSLGMTRIHIPGWKMLTVELHFFLFLLCFSFLQFLSLSSGSLIFFSQCLLCC